MRKLLTFWLLALAGCAGTPRPPASVLIQPGAVLQPPTIEDVAPTPRVFVLAPRDYVAVTVYALPQLSLERIQVDDSGNIAVPLAGTLLANGKTPAALSMEIQARLQVAHVRDPRVAVNIIETKSQLLTVDGEVTNPGQYPVLGRMTLSRAVASAEGVTEFANTRYVLILRTVAGKRYAALYDLRAIRSGATEDPEVYANDSILVGESRARRIFRDVLTASPLIVTPLIALLQNRL